MSRRHNNNFDDIAPRHAYRDPAVPGHTPHNGILVPESLADALREEENARIRSRIDSETQARLDRANREFHDLNSKPKVDGLLDQLTKNSRRRRKAAARGAWLQVFDPAHRQRYVDSVQHLARVNEKRSTLESAMAPYASFEDGSIPLVRIRTSMLAALTRLTEEMPNFAGVIDAIAPMLQLQLAGDRVIRLPPLLLAGPPGIGKTYFVGRLAKVLTLHYAIINIETASAGWILSGASTVWATGQPGMVFKTLGSAGHANPLILIDELDKGSQDKRYDPLGALYSLLEPHSAARFKDEALPEMPVDASAINWMATANDVSAIPEPIRSRMQVVELPLPSSAQKQKIAKSLYASLRKSNRWGRKFDAELGDGAARALAVGASVRDMRHTLTKAFAIASTEGRSRLLPSDIAAAVKASGSRFDLESVEPEGHA